MGNTREELVDRFFVLSGEGLVQSARGVGIPNADLDTRDKCTITRELIVDRKETRDCRDEFLTGRKIRTRYARITLNYTELTPHIIHRWSAPFLGAAVAPTGTPANEVQSLAVSGMSAGDTLTLAMTLEGRTVTTEEIVYPFTAAEIQAALVAPGMLFIQPGDAVVSGTGPYVVTFPQTGRLGRANLPILVAVVSAGSVTPSQSTPGEQRFHVATRSTSRDKLLNTFALGWDDQPTRVEKYIDYAVESMAPTLSLDGDVGMAVTLIGPWAHKSIEEDFDIPDCVNIDPLPVSDCRVIIDGTWQSEDINTLTATVNDNIPVDRISSFGFDGIEMQRTRRGPQPSHQITAGLFGSEIDSIYAKAADERTAEPVSFLIHFGMPGNRCSWVFDKTEIAFQNNPLGQAGAADVSVIQIEGTPVRNGAATPFDVEGYLEQSTIFIDTP